MKTKNILFWLGSLLIVVVFYSCKNSDLFNSAETTMASDGTASLSTTTLINDTNPFKSTVGVPIQLATGIQWIENYKRENAGQGKEYILAAQDLKNILSNTDCVGICLYFALDENLSPQLLPIGINSNGHLMKTSFINTNKATISWETAQKWIANDPGEIDARFFGRNTFIRLFRDVKLSSLRAINALDELNKPQLLLINTAVNYNSKDLLSTALVFEDRSSPCPPICGISD
ncbi:MAG: hypothetical protein ACKOW2_01485 [Sphingobacteriaceae bacterium]